MGSVTFNRARNVFDKVAKLCSKSQILLIAKFYEITKQRKRLMAKLTHHALIRRFFIANMHIGYKSESKQRYFNIWAKNTSENTSSGSTLFVVFARMTAPSHPERKSSAIALGA